jgi:preprotein translocase subunit SecE
MKIIKFFKEVKAEAKRVSWASFSQTRLLTVIVLIIAVLFAIYMLAVDAFLKTIMDFIIQF